MTKKISIFRKFCCLFFLYFFLSICCYKSGNDDEDLAVNQRNLGTSETQDETNTAPALLWLNNEALFRQRTRAKGITVIWEAFIQLLQTNIANSSSSLFCHVIYSNKTNQSGDHGLFIIFDWGTHFKYGQIRPQLKKKCVINTIIPPINKFLREFIPIIWYQLIFVWILITYHNFTRPFYYFQSAHSVRSHRYVNALQICRTRTLALAVLHA